MSQFARIVGCLPTELAARSRQTPLDLLRSRVGKISIGDCKVKEEFPVSELVRLRIRFLLKSGTDG